MATYAGQPSSFYATTGGVPVEGAWYSGRRYLNGQLLAPGEYEPGKMTSNEVISQTNPNNVSYIEKQRISANQIQAPSNTPAVPSSNSSSLNKELEAARKALEQSLAKQAETNSQQLKEARAKETATLEEAKPLTAPFREDLEKTERERLGTDQVLADQKELLGELDQLLTEGNELIRQQKSVTGLAVIRNPRIQQTMEDVAARAGVINAVVSLQNTYLANAYQSIDRSVAAITADRQDRLNYYNTVLSLANRDIIELTTESRRIAEQQTNLLQFDLSNAQDSVNEIKRLMLDPASASLMARAGVSLNDSVETINAKMSQAQYEQEIRDFANDFTTQGAVAVMNPSSVPASQLRSFTDSRGQVHYYKMPKSGSGVSTADSYLKGLTTDTTSSSSSTTRTQTKGPQFTPAGGTGAIWIDPATGVMWQFTSSGWKKVS